MTKEKRMSRLLAPIGVIAISLAMASVALAGPGKKKGARALLKSHMSLAEYYMLDGQYDKALGHFEAIIDFEIALPSGSDPGAEAFGGGGGDKKKARKRGGKKKKVLRAKLRAHMGAAIAAYKLGKQDKAESFAESGIEFAQRHGVKRGAKMFERFLDDPDEVVEVFAPSVKELEARIVRVKKALEK